MRRALVLVLLCVALPAAEGGDAPNALGGRLVAASGIRAGLCVQVGCTDGRLTAAYPG